jgi:Spy/CpxP family protein refolding chaperone
MKRNKSLVGIIILLLLLNLATIGTILYNKYHHAGGDKSIVLSAEGNNLLNSHFIKETVGFDQKQMQLFRNANLEFRPKANSIVIQIDTLKNRMFSELKKPKADTVKLNALADRTGFLHAELKRETNRFYLKIKTICTPEQLNKLQSTFSPLFCKGSCCQKGMSCKGDGKECKH